MFLSLSNLQLFSHCSLEGFLEDDSFKTFKEVPTERYMDTCEHREK